ncbi:MAG: ISAs1 family transposase [Mesorhizobium sp.]|nr:ISAs1 family transposase [Mesorhizobium sp. M9A.F.Ca.ET.002.03.1.2]AZO25564.1 ISAs1 family transposase [Mesorhizobium sp. M1E.F.Ca.ET.045.02.1.1]RWB62803.1 MAG: ISAs1 family transposase [Mesorhizobium sp.]TGQ36893.1 ISAs1 family transposase [Mesorhizobium sp. M00.F.Ca.ET.216.01.1.1]RWJ43578.1 MAG: ISAs1 family transposase [Mesorhizobium sp.]
MSSRILTAKAFAEAARAHWGIENGLHWVLDVQFKEDQSRLRRGHGATNMAMVRHLALNLIRAMPGKRSDDLIWIGGPSEGFRLLVVLCNEAVDRRLEVTTEWKTPRLRRRFDSFAKKPSTALSHEHEVGVKWKVKR